MPGIQPRCPLLSVTQTSCFHPARARLASSPVWAQFCNPSEQILGHCCLSSPEGIEVGMLQRTKQYTLSRSQPCVSGHQTATCNCAGWSLSLSSPFAHITESSDNIVIFVLSEFLKVFIGGRWIVKRMT